MNINEACRSLNIRLNGNPGPSEMLPCRYMIGAADNEIVVYHHHKKVPESDLLSEWEGYPVRYQYTTRPEPVGG